MPNRHAVVLAAGAGSRLGADTHKSLLPVAGEGGTLARLLTALDGARITVVTGADHEAVAREVKAASPHTRVVHDPTTARNPLSALRAAIRDLTTDDIITFHADTTHLPDFMEALWATPVGVTAVTVHRGPAGGHDQEIGVHVRDGRILDIGPDVRTGAWMGPCVMWAASDLTLVASATNMAKQWQVLAELIGRGGVVAAVEVPADSFFDVDTEDDLRHARERLSAVSGLTRDELIFRRTVSKDELPVGRRGPHRTFIKTCPDEPSAATEFQVLDLLYSAGVDVPRPRARQSEVVTMDLVEGIRVFDLLRRLSQQAPELVPGFLGRLRERLDVVQGLLFDNRADLPSQPYPFGTKVVAMVRLLSRLLDVAEPDPAEVAQWTHLSSEWHRIVDTPFRDATTKNMILAHPLLAVDAPDRWDVLADLLASEPEVLLQAPLVDVDFSLCGYRTTAADDWVSLLMHEATAPWSRWPSDPDLAGLAHLDLTLLVRYVRFGGRKMTYTLLHPAAAGIRFAHDDAGYYFRRLPDLLRQVSPDFATDNDLVVRRIHNLSTAFDLARPGGSDPWRDERALWQESPLELP